jgi:hypothetical protein
LWQTRLPHFSCSHSLPSVKPGYREQARCDLSKKWCEKQAGS